MAESREKVVDLAHKVMAREASPHKHLLIAGTGRAGTSFLVRYLSAVGLDTHVTRRGSDAEYDEAAQAGFEDLPLSKVGEDLPYVIKSPWTCEFIDEVISDPQVRLDGVIIPVRDLMESAASRVIVERRAIHEHHPWMAHLSESWEHYGQTPGGVVYSLNPLDQARVLALGFHHLIERLVQADIPLRLLAFPRLAFDPDYLFAQLRPWLPEGMSQAEARERHEAVADLKKIRTAKEMARAHGEFSSRTVEGASHLALDRAALCRELDRVRKLLTASESERRAGASRVEQLGASLESLHKIVREQAALIEQADEVAEARAISLRALRESHSWRLTAPLRAISGPLKSLGLYQAKTA
ncbi:MAG: hypothetical protein WA840_24425 [Caulobacteraceae bacterium]